MIRNSVIKILILVFLFGFSNCVSKKVGDKIDLTCISEEELAEKKKAFSPIFPRLSDKKPGTFQEKWELLRSECWKKLYKVDDIYVFLHRDYKSKKILGQLSGALWKKAPVGCLDKAIGDTLAIEVPYSKNIIESSKDFYGPLWNDPDVGPASWLACEEQEKKTSGYYGSLGTFVHELNHLAGNKEGNCSFYPWENRHDCFPKDKKDSSLQQLNASKKLSALDKKTRDSILSTQTMYLGNAKSAKNPVILLDELRSYVVGVHHMGSILKKYGRVAVYNEKKKRPTLLPLMAVYDLVMRYRLERLKDEPSFEKNKLNRMMVDSLDLASKTVSQWKATEEEFGDKRSKAAEIEEKVWKVISN